MMSYQMMWEALALGFDVVVAYVFYKAYRNKEEDANIVSKAISYSAGDDLKEALKAAPNRCIAYACVDGITEPASGMIPFKSHFTGELGIVRHELLVEHKSKRVQGFWSDVKRVIKDVTNIRPFCIVSPESSTGQSLKVEVTDALSAEYFLDHLPVTYDRFDETKDGFMARALDRLFGEVTKGYQETERMLGLGVPIIGLGMLSFDDKRIILSPPEGGRRYIVTTLSKPEMVHLLKSDIRFLKVCFWICAAVGAGIFGYILFRFVRRQMALERNRRIVNELRFEAAQHINDGNDNDNNGNGRQCVICLNNPREVVILDCGHVCICSECAVALPDPKFCPICRSIVNRFVPIYIA